jgi:hypothetical protein
MAGENERSLDMATRIYSLAKDLGLDNKELVEIVKRAGITGYCQPECCYGRSRRRGDI